MYKFFQTNLFKMQKFRNLTKLFDLKLITVLSVIMAIIINNFRFNEKCLENIMNKIPISIVSKTHNRNEEIVFIGGTGYSGEMLIKEILNYHTKIYCQIQSNGISRILMNSLTWQKDKEVMRLREAGISKKIIDYSISSFILEILSGTSKIGKTLCTKDLSIFNYINETVELFPNSKHILMIRDPRSSIYEQVKRENISESSRFYVKFQSWVPLMKSYYNDCVRLGEKNCIAVFYEKLVTNEREEELKRLFKFLKLPWTANLLNFEKQIQNSDEIERPVSERLIKEWIIQLPNIAINQLENITEFLKKIGY